MSDRSTRLARPGHDPPPSLAEVRRRRDVLLATAAQYRAANVRVFGSVARGDADAESDVDFLIDMPDDYRLLELGGIYTAFEDLLGRPVHVVVAADLPEVWRVRAEGEAVPL